MYAGTSGSTQGERNDTIPAVNAVSTPSVAASLMAVHVDRRFATLEASAARAVRYRFRPGPHTEDALHGQNRYDPIARRARMRGTNDDFGDALRLVARDIDLELCLILHQCASQDVVGKGVLAETLGLDDRNPAHPDFVQLPLDSPQLIAPNDCDNECEFHSVL